MSQVPATAPQAVSAPAPVADAPAAQASEQGGEQTLDSTDDIADYLDNQDHSGDPAATAQPDNSQGQDEVAPETAGVEAPNDAAPDAVPAPASWSKEEKAVFAALPAEAKQAITRRETEREALVNRKAEEANQARVAHDRLMQHAQGALSQAIVQAQAAMLGEYGDIDMLALQQADPMTFIQVDAAIKKRQANMQPVMERLREMQQYQQQQNTERQAALIKAEIPVAKERLTAVIGQDMDPKAWRKEVETYLDSLGCPKEHAQGLTHAYQLELIAKAMQYDKMKTNAASAERKVAEAPRVMKHAGAGGGSAGQSEKQKGAWEALRQNPKSTDAIANLLGAIE